jgi:hypothetical protein
MLVARRFPNLPQPFRDRSFATVAASESTTGGRRSTSAGADRTGLDAQGLHTKVTFDQEQSLNGERRFPALVHSQSPPTDLNRHPQPSTEVGHRLHHAALDFQVLLDGYRVELIERG